MVHRLSVALVLAACGSEKPAPVAPSQPPPKPVALVPADAPGPSQDEILAAIQKAMTDLDGPAHTCWAAAATERFDVEGELELRVDVGQGSANVTVAKDSSNSKRLATCMTALLTGYRFAPPLMGQSFQLPFKFTAPDGQSVIDRRLVEAHAQGNVAVSVLLDENNTGNAHASMFEVAIQPGAATGPRQTERAELWYFLTPGEVTSGVGHVDPGDIVFVPAHGTRDVRATTETLRAVLVIVPGGREGAARAGALPTPTTVTDKPPKLVALRGKDAKTYGPATIYLDDSIRKGTPLAASILKLPAGAKVPEHVHANETEMLYVLDGAGTMTVAGTDVPVTASSVVQIPPNTKHAFAGTEAVRSLQIYTPAGPEQRFKKK